MRGVEDFGAKVEVFWRFGCHGVLGVVQDGGFRVWGWG